MAFREVGGGDVHTLEEGQKLTGTLVEIKTNQGQDNNSTIITIETDSGKCASIWSSAVLDGKLADVRVGDYIQVEYLGKKKSEKTNREYKDWKLLVDEEKRRTVASAPAPEMGNEPAMSSEPTDGGEKMPWD